MSDLAYKADASLPARNESAQGATVVDVRPVPRVSIQAFCESADLIAAVNAAAQDRRMTRAHVKVQTGGIAAAAEFYQQAATPNLIIVESKLPRERLETELDRLSAVESQSSSNANTALLSSWVIASVEEALHAIEPALALRAMARAAFRQ